MTDLWDSYHKFYVDSGVSQFLFVCFQLFLNYLDNYLPDKWNFRDGCTACAEDTISLDKLKVHVAQRGVVWPVFCFHMERVFH